MDYTRLKGKLSLRFANHRDANRFLVNRWGEPLSKQERVVSGEQNRVDPFWRWIWFKYPGIAISRPGRYYFHLSVWYSPADGSDKWQLIEVCGGSFHCSHQASGQY